MSDETNATPESTTEATPAASFGMQDLVFTLQVYEACAQRGAFRAEELTNIGAVYDRLKAFLVANGVFNNAAADPTTQDGSTAASTGE